MKSNRRTKMDDILERVRRKTGDKKKDQNDVYDPERGVHISELMIPQTQRRRRFSPKQL